MKTNMKIVLIFAFSVLLIIFFSVGVATLTKLLVKVVWLRSLIGVVISGMFGAFIGWFISNRWLNKLWRS